MDLDVDTEAKEPDGKDKDGKDDSRLSSLQSPSRG